MKSDTKSKIIVTMVITVIIVGLGCLIALPFLYGGTWSDGSQDRFASCLLYQKTLIGDDEEMRMSGKTSYAITIHYYNVTYICGDQYEMRVEKVEQR